MQNEVILSNRINYLIIYREKKLLQEIYHSTFVKKSKINYFCNLKNKNKIFKNTNRSDYKVVKNIKGTSLYINNDFIQNISNYSSVYLTEYNKKILKINNNSIKINYRQTKYNFDISKRLNLSDYKLIPFDDGIDSVKNTAIVFKNQTIMEILRLPDNCICVAFKEPFNFLFSFIIGVAKFINN